MSLSSGTQDGGGGGGTPEATMTYSSLPTAPPIPILPPASPYPYNCSYHHRNDSCPQSPNITLVTSVFTILSLTTVMTTTISSDVVSTYTSISFSVTPVLLPQNPSMTEASLAAETSLFNNMASLTRGNTAAVSALGAITIVLIIGLAIFFFIYFRRQRQSRNNSAEESPPLTSLAPNRPTRPQSLHPTTSRSPAAEEASATSLSMGPRPAGYGGAALKSHPVTTSSRPNMAKRSSSAPNLNPPDRPPRIPTLRGIPAINIPATIHDSDSRPNTSTSASRMPMYHEALQEEAERERERVERENAGRLGLPVIERRDRESRESMESDMEERFAGGNAGGNGARREAVLHSTRASSGIFPEGHEKDEEGNWSSRGSVGSGGDEDGEGRGRAMEDVKEEEDNIEEKEKLG